MAQTYNNFSQAQQKLANIVAIDYFFAKEMVIALSTRLASESVNEVALSKDQEHMLMHLFMALSESLRAGHTCLPLSEISDKNWAVAYDELGQCSHQGYFFPSAEVIKLHLRELNIDANSQQPIVFDNKNLYMRRYFQFECELSQGITKRLEQQASIAMPEITSIIDELFPSNTPQSDGVLNEQQIEIDWQKIAVANAINKNFTVIAGGPGTGKTYTVTKLLAALLMIHSNSDSEEILEIALVAPTGKAAQRLSESIIKAISSFKGQIDDETLAAMPTQAKTIHRLLGVIPNSPNFRHNQNNLLSCDVLLIDEVSMVDLPMMTRIFRALKPNTKVILLGDADQLPSVAVGSVLADISPRPHCGYSEDNLNYLAQVCQLESKRLQNSFELSTSSTSSHHDHLSFLMKSRRFDGEGGIGKLAALVIKGQATQSWQLLESPPTEAGSTNVDLTTDHKPNQLSLVDNNLNTWLIPLVHRYYQGIAKCNNIDDAFTMLAKFRVLCVTRQGEFGVDALNQWIKELLIHHYNRSQTSYHGMPIMISENDYRLGLFNGDIGLLWRTEDGHLMAFFENSDQTVTQAQVQAQDKQHQTEQERLLSGKSYKVLLPSRLPKYDAVYAMTIHKTQGSEFDHVAIVLPKQAEHQLLSRELLYTGITRAKSSLTISSNKLTWQFGVKTAIKRYSGLTL
jgi:exodeoxyribonuclease V alpha subunit